MALLIRKELAGNSLLGVWKIEENDAWYFNNPLLTERVQSRIDGYKSVQRKLQAIAVRILIKTLLPSEKNVDIGYNEKNKPFFTEALYKLSITHSRNMVAVLLSDTVEVGVDIEKQDLQVERVAHKFMNSEEESNYASILESEKLDYLHVLWGAKECMYKLYGKGGLDFREDMTVHKFDLKSQGDFTGMVSKDERLIHVAGVYTKLDNFVLVYVLEKRGNVSANRQTLDNEQHI